jgi:hypothetical protein
MTLVYTLEAIPSSITKSIFLAGPSLRPEQEHLVSWRIKAIEILKMLNYDGVVFVPESRGGNYKDLEFSKVNDWEFKCLNMADNILFYINRDISKNILGLTTNTEIGLWFNSGKCILCTEPNADNIRYQESLAKKYNVPLFHDLYNSFKCIIDKQGEGAIRNDGERCIPLLVWNHPGFQSYYTNMKLSGNQLIEAKVLDVSMIKDFLFSFKLWVNIFIKSENRYKNNEFVITRTDISACVLFYPRPDILESEVVIIKEFRSPVNNKTGFVYEIPGGSSFKPNMDPKETILEEIYEECGFTPDINKLNFIQNRQLASTMLTHQAHVWSYELDMYELNEIKQLSTTTHGNIEDTELTYIEIHKVYELLSNTIVDWSNMGMILSTVIKNF